MISLACKMNVKRCLTDFLGLPEGTFVSRAEAIEAIVYYINKNGLRIREGRNAKTIIRDAKLNTILAERILVTQAPGYTGPDVYCTNVEVCNLLKFLKHNFLEKAPDEFQPTVEEIEYKCQRLAEERKEKRELFQNDINSSFIPTNNPAR
jgi:hypothetical protein